MALEATLILVCMDRKHGSLKVLKKNDNIPNQDNRKSL